MENKYLSAKRICLDALHEFRIDVNEHLPDNPGSDNLKYLIDWTLEDCAYIQRCIDRVVNAILSTCMADHVSYELHIHQDAYASAMKEKDIRRCQHALNGFMKEARIVHAACRAIPEEGHPWPQRNEKTA